MTGLKEHGKRVAARLGAVPDTCGVKGCQHGDAEVIDLKPLDPLDHTSTLIQLCPTHQEWAEERNALAEAVAEELREYRREIRMERIDEIQRLTLPQGEIREDILDGSADDGYIGVSDALEDPR